MSARKEELLRTAAILAADFSRQATYLYELGVPDGVDELALEFDAIAAASGSMLQEGEMTRMQHDKAVELNNILTAMSGPDSIEWTLTSLATSDRWKTVRELAGNLVDLLMDG